ncbi:unnamed protein product [Trichogramma brassicae]|uniref:Uncharacterized protein n=1 Tax=Trichogramma brassicae TaxID=86971 RepID=A0A6H5IIV0_9HYME|nr:unnamed protein product [Trichogramma brassicae]
MKKTLILTFSINFHRETHGLHRSPTSVCIHPVRRIKLSLCLYQQHKTAASSAQIAITGKESSSVLFYFTTISTEFQKVVPSCSSSKTRAKRDPNLSNHAKERIVYYAQSCLNRRLRMTIGSSLRASSIADCTKLMIRAIFCNEKVSLASSFASFASSRAATANAVSKHERDRNIRHCKVATHGHRRRAVLLVAAAELFDTYGGRSIPYSPRENPARLMESFVTCCAGNKTVALLEVHVTTRVGVIHRYKFCPKMVISSVKGLINNTKLLWYEILYAACVDINDFFVQNEDDPKGYGTHRGSYSTCAVTLAAAVSTTAGGATRRSYGGIYIYTQCAQRSNQVRTIRNTKNSRKVKPRKTTSDWLILTTTPDASRLDTSTCAANCQQTVST